MDRLKILPRPLFLLVGLVLGFCAVLSAQTTPCGPGGIVRITGSGREGTAICLDTPCSHLLTNYHVAAFLRPGMKIEGVPIAGIKSATGPDDDGTRQMQGLDKSFLLRFNPQHDLSLLTLEKPLPPRFRGLRLAAYQANMGQKVTRVAYRKKKLNLNPGEILALRAVLRSPEDSRPTTAFSTLLVSFPSGPGNSGGAICDSDGAVLGVVYGAQVVDANRGTDITASSTPISIGTLALPIASVSRFLREQDPELWTQLFVVRSRASDPQAVNVMYQVEDDSPARVPLASRSAGATLNTRLKLDAPPVKPAGADSDALIVSLRLRAKANLARIRSLFAEQEIVIWGEDQPKEVWRHEVAVYGNRQTFRQIKNNGTRGEVLANLPYPKKGVRPGGEWYHLLNDLARAPLRYLGASTLEGKTVHVYSFAASLQEKVCYYSETDGGFWGGSHWMDYVDCTGQLIADEEFNTLEISRELYPPFGRLTWIMHLNVLFEFLDVQNEAKLTLVPTSIRMAAQFETGEWYFASGTWKDYHRFQAKARMLPEYSETESP